MAARKGVYNLTISALLCAIGIMIPMIMPIKLVIPPASFTLASHVAIFVAMFVSPVTAVSVAVGTTIGFFFSGLPIEIVARAATHVIFASIGAFYLRMNPFILDGNIKARVFSFIIGLIHGACEVAVIIPFYFGGALREGFYQNGFFVSVVLLVGIGTLVHSMIDFEIALFVWKIIRKSLKLPYQTVKTKA